MPKKGWRAFKGAHIIEARKLEVQLAEMTQRDRFRIGHRQAIKIFEAFRLEAWSSGDRVTGWAGKVE